jgi:transposase
MIEHGFTRMEWPPNSPDLNPIEHLWAYLKHELNRRYPDTKDIRGGPDTVKRVLVQRLLEVWWDIGEGVLNRLIDSMPRRVQAVLDAKGWYTEY